MLCLTTFYPPMPAGIDLILHARLAPQVTEIPRSPIYYRRFATWRPGWVTGFFTC
jgi:hypothetical protein